MCDPATIFLTSKFIVVYFFWTTPPIKLKLGLQIGERLLIAKHLDQSWTRCRKSDLLHSFLTGVVRLCCAFTSLSKQCQKKCWAKTILLAEPNWHVLTFLCLILICGSNTYRAPVEFALINNRTLCQITWLSVKPIIHPKSKMQEGVRHF